MPNSDSEGFESADEGNNEVTISKKERKKRNSSSNYSEKDIETDGISENKKSLTPKLLDRQKHQQDTADGWDDFDVDDEDSIPTTQTKSKVQRDSKEMDEPVTKVEKSKDTGWDDFDDWEATDHNVESEQSKLQQNTKIQSVADRLAATSVKEESKGWGWGGWGVDSLLSTATAGISSLTTHVSQGITTVLETGIGAPDPEELAKRTAEVKSNQVEEKPMDAGTTDGDGAFPFGNLISGVTKFVESTGTKVITGGLDTLETIGKKTMEVLQENDPGLVKKRAIFGLDQDKPVLSQVLKEAKAKADEDDRIKEVKREAKEVHYETLFDDFEGLVHLEALEMLSKQVSMRIEERLRSVDIEKRKEIKETLQQVAELCEMPDDDDDDDEPSEGDTKSEIFHEHLQKATEDLGLKLQFQSLVDHYEQTQSDLQSEMTDKQTYKKAVSCLAQYTALSVELYHKAGEMLLVKNRRSTADEADALMQLTVVLTKHISELANLFTEKLNSISSDNKDQLNTYITNVFLEAGNSSTYIQNAFQLALPILQIGAV